MAKYLSKNVILSAYRELAHLTNEPDKQGQVQLVSGLKYVVALSRFAKVNRRDFDTRLKSDKDLFDSYVGEVVALDDAWATKNFYDGFTSDKHFDTGSNLYSAGVVKDSRNVPTEMYPYPRRSGKLPLFSIKNGYLLADSLSPSSLQASEWFTRSSLRVAFIVWLCRAYELPENIEEDAILFALREILLNRYTPLLVEGLWGNSPLDIDVLNVPSGLLLSDNKAVITKKDLEICASAVGDILQAEKDVENKPRNWIFFGAPGTGKSYRLNELANGSFFEEIRRVTFYPDYTYSQFVGCYKPIAKDDGTITYQFVSGPFLETYLDAVSHPDKYYLLIIEEINRTNPAAVFGDVFQLLDRDADGRSAYDISVPFEVAGAIESYWFDATNVSFDEKEAASKYYGFNDQQEMLAYISKKMSIPSNMYIWATMNSADQGVFPMDTAFKRRWDFRYMGINEGENADIGGTPLSEIEVRCGDRLVKWNNLRRAINEFMSSDELKINEDKLLGPFFVNPRALTVERFASVFKDKVLLYLFEDAGKTKRAKMFRKELKTYSQICEAFDEKGEWIFGNGFDNHIVFPDEKTDSDDLAELQE